MVKFEIRNGKIAQERIQETMNALFLGVTETGFTASGPLVLSPSSLVPGRTSITAGLWREGVAVEDNDFPTSGQLSVSSTAGIGKGNRGAREF
jgi:hypothetical protein